MKKLYVLAIGGFSPPVLSALAEKFNVHHVTELGDAEAELNEDLRDAIVAICNEPNRGVTAKTINALPNLRVISIGGTGFDAVDLGSARSRNIIVTNTPGTLSDEVADFAIGLMLASARQLVAGDKFVRNGKWLTGAMPLNQSVGYKTMGIIGLGEIGRAIADRGAAFKMRILYTGPHRKSDVPYDYIPNIVELAHQSDYLMIACKGGAETKNLVSAEVIEALGPTGTLVNVARGSVVDELAMINSLKTGRLGHAALDVFWNAPNINPDLLELQNVIVQPQHGSGTVETRARIGATMISNLLTELDGRASANRLF